MLDWLDRLRQKPDEIKNQYVLFGAILITSIIIVIWGLTLPDRLAKLTTEEELEAAAEHEGALSQFFSDVQEGVGAAFQGVNDTIATSSATTTGADSTAVATSSATTTDFSSVGVLLPDLSESEPSIPSENTILIATSSSASDQ